MEMDDLHDIRSWLAGERARNRLLNGCGRLTGSALAVEHVEALLAEVDRLRALNESLASRVAAQSELLSRRAEKPAP